MELATHSSKSVKFYLFFWYSCIKTGTFASMKWCRDFLCWFRKNNIRRRKIHFIAKKFSIIVKFSKNEVLSESLKNIFARSGIRTCRECYSFTRLCRNGIEYDSKSYKRQRKTINYFAKYELQDTLCIGIIKKFMELCRCNCRDRCANYVINTNYCVIHQKCKVLEIILRDVTFHLISLCQISNEEIIAIEVYDLENVCYTTENDDDRHLFPRIDAVNTVEFHYYVTLIIILK